MVNSNEVNQGQIVWAIVRSGTGEAEGVSDHMLLATVNGRVAIVSDESSLRLIGLTLPDLLDRLVQETRSGAWSDLPVYPLADIFLTLEDAEEALHAEWEAMEVGGNV
ncbi:MAG: hypothetical protein MJ074_07160 [Oscillospiraceae bacterium]|nr:hypothetical protein [Oscillospiraceae bacterium]